MALDLESVDPAKHMSFDDARIFIKRIKEKTAAIQWSMPIMK